MISLAVNPQPHQNDIQLHLLFFSMASPSSRRPSLSTGRLAAPSRSSGPSPAGSWTNPPLVQIPPRLASASDSPNASGIQSAISLDKRTVTSAAAASNLSASLGKVADGQQRQQQPNDYFASPSAAGPSTPNTKGSTSPSATPADSLDAIPDEEKARILNRHLVGASERRGSNAQSVAPDVSSLRHGASSMSRNESGLSLGDSDGSQPVADSEEFSIPYESQGGDVTYVSTSLSSIPPAGFPHHVVGLARDTSSASARRRSRLNVTLFLPCVQALTRFASLLGVSSHP